jgi:hypothetical protein
MSRCKKRAKEARHAVSVRRRRDVECRSCVRGDENPEAFLFDKEGELVYHGAIDDNAQEPAKVESPYLRNALGTPFCPANRWPKKRQQSIGCRHQVPFVI